MKDLKEFELHKKINEIITSMMKYQRLNASKQKREELE